MRRIAPVLLAIVLCLPGGRVDADAAAFVVIAAAELRAQPAEGAASRGRIDRGAAVERGERSAGWVRVRRADGGEGEGWLRVWQVRAAEPGGGNPLLRGLQRFSRRIAGLFRSDDSGIQDTPVTATIGVRGLDAGEFERAAPAPGALRQVQALRASRDQAAAFAREAGLQRREIATLASPESRDWGEW